jgi:hypothetical protein
MIGDCESTHKNLRHGELNSLPAEGRFTTRRGRLRARRGRFTIRRGRLPPGEGRFGQLWQDSFKGISMSLKDFMRKLFTPSVKSHMFRDTHVGSWLSHLIM